MENPFFKNYGPFKVSEILDILELECDDSYTDQKITNIKDLFSSQLNEITFFHSTKYIDIAKNTKASFCITTENLKHDLNKSCKPIVVKNVLIATAAICAKFYPDSISDNYDTTVKDINKTEFINKVKYGKNVLIGHNVSIGSNCLIGHNTIIEKNVSNWQ